MKRILFLCMAITMIMSGAVSAEISKEKDESGLIVSSELKERYTTNLVKTVCLKKHVVDNEVFYRLIITVKSDFKEYLLLNRAPALTIDKYPKTYFNEYHYNGNDYYSSIEVDISTDIVTRIAKAKDAYLIVESGWGSFVDIKPMLAEWK